MPPFIRDDVPFVWCQEEQNQEQNQDNNLNAEPIQEDNELSSDDQALDVALLQVRAAVERNAVEADRAGINVVTFHQRNAVYSNLLFEFVTAVDRKIALNREPATAETAIEHSALTAQINRLVREVCEFNISYN